MGFIQPAVAHRDEGLEIGHVGLVPAANVVLCDHCKHSTRSAVGLVRDWQPTVWTCSSCLADRLDV